MLPTETKVLLDEIIAHLRPEHETQKSKGLRELKFKMANQGLLNSSAFNQAHSQVYCEVLEAFAARVWSETKRVLEATHFEFYSDCEQDLIQFLNSAVAVVYEADRKSLEDEKNPASSTARVGFEFRYQQATKKVA